MILIWYMTQITSNDSLYDEAKVENVDTWYSLPTNQPWLENIPNTANTQLRWLRYRWMRQGVPLQPRAWDIRYDSDGNVVRSYVSQLIQKDSNGKIIGTSGYSTNMTYIPWDYVEFGWKLYRCIQVTPAPAGAFNPIYRTQSNIIVWPFPWRRQSTILYNTATQTITPNTRTNVVFQQSKEEWLNWSTVTANEIKILTNNYYLVTWKIILTSRDLWKDIYLSLRDNNFLLWAIELNTIQSPWITITTTGTDSLSWPINAISLAWSATLFTMDIHWYWFLWADSSVWMKVYQTDSTSKTLKHNGNYTLPSTPYALSSYPTFLQVIKM